MDELLPHSLPTLPPGSNVERVEVAQLDHLVLLSHIWDSLGLTTVIDACVPADEQVRLSPGLALKALVLNIVSGRAPLYRVEEFYTRHPISLIIDGSLKPSDVNDTALARALDRLHAARLASLFTGISFRVMEREGLSRRCVHADTTSKLVFGEYAHPEAGAVSITHGHSKDHRPDLKQVMFGVGCVEEGVPSVATMLDGNCSDKVWHKDMLRGIRKHLVLNPNAPLDYVGDSAVMTRENMQIAREQGIHLTGRFPRSFSACLEVIAAANARAEDWQDIGKVAERKAAASYQAQVFERELDGQAVAMGVYRSLMPNRRVEHSVKRAHARVRKETEKQARHLHKREFSCRADAEAAALEFGASIKDHALRVCSTVQGRSVRVKNPRRGRPRRDALAASREVFSVRVSFSSNDEVLRARIASEGAFVILHTGTLRDAGDILRLYKGQAHVEKRFPFLKAQTMADVFFVKTPHRLEALGWAMLIALLLWSVWERRVRKNLEAAREPPLRDKPRNLVKHATAFVCAAILGGINATRLVTPTHTTPWRLAGELSPEQQRVIRLSLHAPPRRAETPRHGLSALPDLPVAPMLPDAQMYLALPGG